jgi:hypothetical protein
MIHHDTWKNVAALLTERGLDPRHPAFRTPAGQAAAVDVLVGEGMGRSMAQGFVEGLSE